MTLREALVATRKRKLRPSGYVAVNGTIIVLFFIVLMVRFGANLYLTSFYAAAHRGTGIMSFYVLANVAWCSLFLAAVAPIASYRAIARTLGSPRLGLFPIRRSRLALAAGLSSILSVPTLVPIALSILTVLLGLTVSGTVGPALPLICTILIALLSFLAVSAAAWGLRVREERLEMIEAALMVIMVYVNPDFRVNGDTAAVVLANSRLFGSTYGAFLPAVPLFGAALSTLLILLIRMGDAIPSVHRRRDRSPGFALYRTRMPLMLFVVGYAVEFAIILTNSRLLTTVRDVVLLMLGIQLFWFLSFLFRSEQQLASVFHAPNRRSTRWPAYRPAATTHLLLCLPPIILFVIRLLVR